jgi:serine/threonine protein kinase
VTSFLQGGTFAEQVRRAAAELRFLDSGTLASAVGDYEPAVAAAAQQQLAAEEAAFAELLPLSGTAHAEALSNLDPEIAEGVRLRRETLAAGDALLGTVDRGFELVRLLGMGGGGRVYLVERQAYAQALALKLMVGWDDAAQRRFDRERAALARMHHPYIVKLLDAWRRDDGQSALLLEWVDGLPITQFADQQRLGVDARLELVENICRAVQYAHELGVLHRDLKPANILVTAGGIPKVLDFGIARVTGELDQTRTAGFFGTFAYASPEQLLRSPVDVRTDVYSLGVVLFELLVGARPHRGDVERLADPERPAPNMAAAFGALAAGEAAKVVEERSTSRRELLSRLRSDVAAVVMKALHPVIDRRYRSVAELASDLQLARRGLPVAARGDSFWYGLQRLVARNKVASTFAAVFLVTVVASGLMQYALRTEAEEQGRRAARVATALAVAFEEFVPDPQEYLRSTSEQRIERERSGMKLAIELLANLDPRDITRDLQLVNTKMLRALGDHHVRYGEEAEGRPYFVAALEKAEDLQRLRPDDPECLLSLGRCLYHVGQDQQHSGDISARSTYQRMLEVRHRLHALDPANAAWLRECVLGEFSMADFEGQQQDPAARMRHLQAAATLADGLVALTKNVGNDFDFAGDIHGMIRAFRAAEGDARGAAEAADRAADLYKRCLVHQPSMESHVQPKLDRLHVDLLESNGDWLAARPIRQRMADAARPAGDPTFPELCNHGIALYHLARVSTRLEDWPVAVQQWHEACVVWTGIADGSAPHRAALRDVLLNTCECHIAHGSIAGQEEFLRKAIAFCAEWREDKEAGPRLESVEEALRKAGIDAKALEATMPRTTDR